MGENRKIKLVSGIDNIFHEINSKIAVNSGLLKSLFEDYPESNEFVIPEIKGEILSFILKYLEINFKEGKSNENSKIFNKENFNLPKPFNSFDLKAEINEDNYLLLEKFNQDIYGLFEIMIAANYLDIKCLLELCCAKAACLIKDYDTEEFLEVFQIEQDMTEADLQERLKMIK
jgi:S-phase kinase-associated protein 1